MTIAQVLQRNNVKSWSQNNNNIQAHYALRYTQKCECQMSIRNK